MYQTLCFGNTDLRRVSVFDRGRLRNTSRAVFNKHLNTSCMLCRKQLTLLRVTGNRVQSSQSPTPSITKVPLSFPVLSYEHTDREENVIPSTQSPSPSPRALPEQLAASHTHTVTAQVRVTLPCPGGLSQPDLAQGTAVGAAPGTAASGSSY